MRVTFEQRFHRTEASVNVTIMKDKRGFKYFRISESQRKSLDKRLCGMKCACGKSDNALVTTSDGMVFQQDYAYGENGYSQVVSTKEEVAMAMGVDVDELE